MLSAVKKDSGNEVKTRAKALYALSSLLRHYPDAIEKFVQQAGWPILHQLIKGTDHLNNALAVG